MIKNRIFYTEVILQQTNFNDLLLTVGDEKKIPSISAKNLGVVIDTNLKLDKYINNTCKSA